MKSCKYNRYSLLLIFLIVSATNFAQKIELLGIYAADDHFYLNARTDLAGKRITGVTTYTYRMSDGYTTTTSSYDLFDQSCISALLTTFPGDCSYRMEVMFDDHTTIRSECINQATRDRFYWVGDFDWSEAVSGWNPAVGGPHPPRVDGNVDPSLNMVVGGTTYYKGISNKAEGYVLYNLPAEKNFINFRSLLGVQDGTGGNLKFNITCNNGATLVFTRTSGTSLDLKTTDYPTYVPNLPITLLKLRLDPNGTNDGDLGHFLLARLYMGAQPTKTSQEITFQTKPLTIIYPQSITLSATATSGEKIHYRIVKGGGLASLNGNVITFADNKAGEVVVEAIQFGNQQFAAANRTLSFHVNTGALIRMSSWYPLAGGNQKMGYLYVDTKGRTLTTLKITAYDNVASLTQVAEKDLLPLLTQNGGTTPQVLAFSLPLTDNGVYRLSYAYENQPLVRSPYGDASGDFDFMSDLSCTYRTGWGSVGIDKPVEGTSLDITGKIFKKGFGIHAVGWLDCSFPADTYDRFVTEVGKQNGRTGLMEFSLSLNGGEITRTGAIGSNKLVYWDFPLKSATNVHMDILMGDGSNSADHGSIGAPRLYYIPNSRREQTLTWRKEWVETRSKPFQLTLDAVASSGLAPVYRIARGEQYATIEKGNVLNIYNLPGKDSILIEAFQPGTHEWAPTAVQTCILRLTRGRIVQKDERIVLENGENLDELTVYADANSCGQVSVASGIAEVKKLILKYTFVPKAWNFVSFPADLNIDKISNLNELGYYQNGKVAGKGAYYIRSYDTGLRAQQPSGNCWKQLNEPTVSGLKGYIMGINNGLGMEPREVVFTIDNVSLDFESGLSALNLTLDLTRTEPYTEQIVYVSPTNVKGNTLKVAVAFKPEDTSELPVNFEQALKNARVTYAPNRMGIRLTLPDQTPAKVAIYDSKMKRLIKAVNYVSPLMIGTSDLKPGTYRMVVSYGNAVDVKSFTK